MPLSDLTPQWPVVVNLLSGAGLVPDAVLIPLLTVVLLVSARKVWGHR